MEECHAITDRGIELLVSQNRNILLEKLVLEGCFRISDRGLQAISKNCKRLRYYFTYFPKQRFLNIKSCQSISSSAISDTLKQFNAVKQLLVIKYQ